MAERPAINTSPLIFLTKGGDKKLSDTESQELLEMMKTVSLELYEMCLRVEKLGVKHRDLSESYEGIVEKSLLLAKEKYS